MTVVRIQKLIILDETVKHISKHGVSLEEVESVIFSDCMITEGHSGRKVLTSRVDNRIVSVIAEMWSNKLKVITARDAGESERQNYYKYENEFKK